MATQQAFGFGTPFAAQIEYLRQKLNLPTQRWDDITGRAHDKAFVVAGVAKADLLADLHTAVLTRATDGAGLNAFRKDFKAIVAKHGWTGWTGEGTTEGEAWRTRVIYQTNMATSYAAGRWAQMTDPEVVKLHPYWRYIHSDGVLNPRQQHVAWHGLTLPWDHPFWKTHFAPNGFNCFPAETVVRCNASLGLKTWYSGEMVEFSTTRGNRLTVTANHPILTRRGWVRAHELNKSDDLIGTTGNIDSSLCGVVDRQHSPSSAEDLFQSLAAQGFRIAPMALDDFHGDAILRKPEIHIAGSNGALMDVAQPALRKLVGKGGLKFRLHAEVEPPFVAVGPAQAAFIKGNTVSAQHVANSGFGNTQPPGHLRLAGESTAIQRKYFALDSGVAGIGNSPSCPELALNTTGRALDGFPAKSLGFGIATQSNSLLDQGSPQGITTAIALFGKLLQANTGLIEVDEVCDVRKYQWAGHVYDFVTTTGLILAGGIIVSNCQCRITSVTRKEGEASARAGLGEPPAGWDAINTATGEQQGIGKGFGYAPGASVARSFQSLVDDKLLKLDAPIGAAMWDALKPVL
uniref:phage head morphogenesis protein n=1 Tax=Rhodoferax sp. TaxID=50421 RepID=UPI00260AED33